MSQWRFLECTYVVGNSGNIEHMRVYHECKQTYFESFFFGIAHFFYVYCQIYMFHVYVPNQCTSNAYLFCATCWSTHYSYVKKAQVDLAVDLAVPKGYMKLIME